VTDRAWWDQASCRDSDPDLFDYDPRHDPPATAEAAKAICAGCTVAADCLEFALRTTRAREDQTGIYGGFTPAERAEQRPPEQPRPWRRYDPEFATASFAKAGEIGTNAAARFYRVDPKTLRASWDQHELGRPARRPVTPVAQKVPRTTAEQAFEVARTSSIANAARRFGVTRTGLRAAWDRYDLGHPHTGVPVAELRSRWNRDHWWRRDERVRRLQAVAERREREQLSARPLGQPAPQVGRERRAAGRATTPGRRRRDEERER
jgi:WhiB family redox-sensing transcriptional regulator